MYIAAAAAAAAAAAIAPELAVVVDEELVAEMTVVSLTPAEVGVATPALLALTNDDERAPDAALPEAATTAAAAVGEEVDVICLFAC